MQHVEGFVAKYPELLAVGKADDYPFVTAAAMDVAATKVPRRGVAVLGASCLRAATDEALIENELRQTGASDQVFNLTSRGQSLWETISIADYIVPSFGGVVIIDTNPLRLSRGHDALRRRMSEPRLGFRSPILEEIASNANIHATPATGYYPWDNREYLRSRLANLFKNLLLGPVVHEHSRLAENVDEDKLDWMSERITQQLESYEEDVEVLLEAISTLASRLSRENATEIILVEPPINPDYIDTGMGRDFYARHMDRMRRFAKEKNIRFWELNGELRLVESNFADWCHLNNTQAREDYSQLLSAYLLNDFL